MGDKFDPNIRAYQDKKYIKSDLINIGKNIYIKKFGDPKIAIDKKEN